MRRASIDLNSPYLIAYLPAAARCREFAASDIRAGADLSELAALLNTNVIITADIFIFLIVAI